MVSPITLRSTLLFLLAVSPILSIPVPQGAGVGAGCNSIASDTDTSTGLAVENAEGNTANLVSGTKPPRRAARWVQMYARQGAGVGAGCDSIASDTDTSTGLAVENAEDNTAKLVSGKPGKRQENKIADGAAKVISAAGDPSLAGTVQEEGDNTDGDSTNDAAAAGQEVGQLELDTLPEAGSAVPKARRQENKIADGAAKVISAAGDPSLAGTVQEEGDNTDGDSTNDAAAAGQEIGQLELDTLPEAGSAVPKKFRL